LLHGIFEKTKNSRIERERSSKTIGLMTLAMPACTAGIKLCNTGSKDPTTGLAINVTACLAALDACNILTEVPIEFTDRNPYDVRIACEKRPLCYDFDAVTKYLNIKEVQQQLGGTGKWGSCNTVVTLAFQTAGDWMKSWHQVIPDMLADGIRTLIYAGDEDYICNWLGNMKWTLALDWPHKADFNAADNKDYQMGNKTVAKVRSSNGFTFMQVFNAGHMVPRDQPAVSLQMVKDHLANKLGPKEQAVVV